MKNYIETPQDPLCSYPRKIAEDEGYEVHERNCKGTIFFELRRSGEVIQNFTDKKKAEQAMIEQAERAKQNKPPLDPATEEMDRLFREFREQNINTEENEID